MSPFTTYVKREPETSAYVPVTRAVTTGVAVAITAGIVPYRGRPDSPAEDPWSPTRLTSCRKNWLIDLVYRKSIVPSTPQPSCWSAPIATFKACGNLKSLSKYTTLGRPADGAPERQLVGWLFGSIVNSGTVAPVLQ